MIAPLPTYEIKSGHLKTDGSERFVASAIGYEATIAAARYLLESGEEDGPLTTHYVDAAPNARELETVEVKTSAIDGRRAILWTTTAGLRRTLR